MCQEHFTGEDCLECEFGYAGPDCTQAAYEDSLRAAEAETTSIAAGSVVGGVVAIVVIVVVVLVVMRRKSPTKTQVQPVAAPDAPDNTSKTTPNETKVSAGPSQRRARKRGHREGKSQSSSESSSQPEKPKATSRDVDEQSTEKVDDEPAPEQTATAVDADGFTMTIGSRVMCDGFKYGEVKYIGPLDELPTDDVYVGVQLDEPDGSCDGSVINGGKRYFTCEPLHGIFSRPNFVTLESGDGN